ncbi:hypothetical protein LSAT2_019228 [Lamellibrachia satsuma]|nr:hypothetical protein LSAT2_019228 [Lamellibrachia satsuma]
MSKGVESGNLMRAFMRNSNEEVKLKNTLSSIERQRSYMLQLWERDVRLLKVTLKCIRTCSGYSQVGLGTDDARVDPYRWTEEAMLYLYERKVFNPNQAIKTNVRQDRAEMANVRAEVRAYRREKDPSAPHFATKAHPTAVLMERQAAKEISEEPENIVLEVEDFNPDNLDAVEVEKKMKIRLIHDQRMKEQKRQQAVLTQRVNKFRTSAMRDPVKTSQLSATRTFTKPRLMVPQYPIKRLPDVKLPMALRMRPASRVMVSS